MELKTGRAPFYRYNDTVRSTMRNMLIVLIALLVMPVVHYGWRPVVTATICVLTCLVSSILYYLTAHKEILIADGAFAVTGMIIALMLPVNVSWYVAIIASAFAMLVAKLPFGGTGNSPFNPAAAGLAFVTISFPSEVFQYFDISSGEKLPPFAGILEVPLTASPTALLKTGARPTNVLRDMLTGGFVGPVGTTAVLVLVACACFLLLRRMAHWEPMVFFLLGGALYSLLFPRVSGLDSVLYEVLSGSFLFVAIFLTSEPGTTPRQPIGRAIYGFLGGVITLLYRNFGAYEQGGCFAILIINALSPTIDRWVWKYTQTDRPKRVPRKKKKAQRTETTAKEE